MTNSTQISCSLKTLSHTSSTCNTPMRLEYTPTNNGTVTLNSESVENLLSSPCRSLLPSSVVSCRLRQRTKQMGKSATTTIQRKSWVGVTNNRCSLHFMSSFVSRNNVVGKLICDCTLMSQSWSEESLTRASNFSLRETSTLCVPKNRIFLLLHFSIYFG